MPPKKLRIPSALVWTAVGSSALGVSLACSSTVEAPATRTECIPHDASADMGEPDACPPDDLRDVDA